MAHPTRAKFVPLSVAAGIAFHTVQRGTRAIANFRDHDEALNMAAAALAQLVAVYASDDRHGRRTVYIDPLHDRFARGATRLLRANGTALSGLSVLQSDLTGALKRLRIAGLPLLPAPAATSWSPKDNRLLAALPDAEYAALAGDLELVPLPAGEVLFAEHTQRRHVDFPVCGVISLLYITAQGAPTEIAVIGQDGAVGLALLLGATPPRRAVVRVAGLAYRIKAPAILAEFRRGGAVQRVLLRYVQSLMNQMAQTAVCNRYHTIEQQLCRWLLLILDRSGSDEVLMTQELISQMLGVRRSGVSEAAKRLQTLGVIDYARGRIVVRNRAKLEAHACECYGIVKAETGLVTPA